MTRIVNMFACYCGAQSEGAGDPPPCWRCDGQMYQWSTREVQGHSTVIDAAKADTRTENGGY